MPSCISPPLEMAPVIPTGENLASSSSNRPNSREEKNLHNIRGYLLLQVEKATKYRKDYVSIGDVPRTVEMGKWLDETVKDLQTIDEIIQNKKEVPRFAFEIRRIPTCQQEYCSDLPGNFLELQVIHCLNLRQTGKYSIQFIFPFFGFQKEETHFVKIQNNQRTAIFNRFFLFETSGKITLSNLIQNKLIHFKLRQKRGILNMKRTSTIAQCIWDISGLLKRSKVEDSIPMEMKEGGEIVGYLSVKARLREPLEKQSVRLGFEQKWLVLKDGKGNGYKELNISH